MKIPQYFSQSNVIPAVNQVQMDPGVAAAPAQAEAQQWNALTNVAQNELKQWEGLIESKKQEQAAAEAKNLKVQAGIYKTNAMANLSMQANALHQTLMQQADGRTNMANAFDEGFSKLSEEALKQAPSDEARMELQQKLTGFRASMYNKVSNESIKLNNQKNMDSLEQILQQYEGFAASNPHSVEDIRTQSQDVFKSMEDLGIPAHQRDKIVRKFNERLDYHSIRSIAESDPITAMQKLDNGDYAALGEGNVTAIRNIAKNSKKAFEKQANDAIRDAEARLMNGQPLPADFGTRLELAQRYDLKDQVEDLQRLMDVDKLVASGDLNTLKQMKSEIQQMSASGKMDANPARVKKLISFLDGNINAMQEDGLSYAERKGGFNPFPIITDFTKVDPAEAEKRKFRALQVQNAYGVKTSALKSEEVQTLSKQLESAPAIDKLNIMNNLYQFGDETVRSVAKSIYKSDAGLSQALMVGQQDLDVATKIIKGQEAIANKAVQMPSSSDFYSKANESLGNLFVDEPDQRKAYVQAAQSLYAYERARGNEISKEDAMDQAGNLVKVERGMWGGYRTVAPASGMDSNALKSFVDTSLSDLNVWKTYGNGLPASAADRIPIKFNSIKPSDFDYLYNSKGYYEVYYEGDPVITDKGVALAVDLKRLHREMKGK